MAAEAFFVRDGNKFVPTELTRGPWDPKAQHGGPPAALLASVLEGCERREDMMVVRMTFGRWRRDTASPSGPNPNNRRRRAGTAVRPIGRT